MIQVKPKMTKFWEIKFKASTYKATYLEKFISFLNWGSFK